MRRTAILVVAVVVLLAVAAAGYIGLTRPPGSSSSSAQSSTGPVTSEDMARAANYLVANYNSTLGLIPETPGSNVFWLYSDNFLASLALSQYGQNNATIARVTAGLSASLSNYLPVGSTVNQYMTLELGACVYHTAVNGSVFVSGSARVETVANNGTGVLNETQYADIAFLDSICQYHNDNSAASMAAYQEGVKMFNGVGMADLPYNQTGRFQTYKLALFVYASVVLGQPVNSTALSTLLRMQAPDGGFYTGYDATYSHGTTQTNTETTSLALLALEAVAQQSS